MGQAGSMLDSSAPAGQCTSKHELIFYLCPIACLCFGECVAFHGHVIVAGPLFAIALYSYEVQKYLMKEVLGWM